MEKYFEQLGILVYDNKLPHQLEEIEMYFINNSDGSLRWLWPRHLKKPLFLKFQSKNNWHSKFYALAVTLIFALKLQKIFFAKKKIYIDQSEKNEKIEINFRGDWTFFTDNTGQNDKCILFYKHENESNFVKIALSSSAKDLIFSEAVVLNTLKDIPFKSIEIPKIQTLSSNFLDIHAFNVPEVRCNVLTPLHLDALEEMADIDRNSFPVGDLEYWQRIKRTNNYLMNIKDNRIPTGMLYKIQRLIQMTDESESIEVSFSHGDFCSNNMFVGKEKLFVYDWELCDYEKPIGFDFFHFIIQQGIMVDQKNWTEIYATIRKTKQDVVPKTLLNKYLKYYLLFNISYHLRIFQEQENWHPQVPFLLEEWNNGLSHLLQYEQNSRELLIIDIFDFLQNKQYVVINMHESNPTKINEVSDLDLCMGESESQELFEMLSNHSFVRKIVRSKKSFMYTCMVFLKDESLINIDMIWKFKVKDLEILDAKEVLKGYTLTNRKVKVMNPIDNARFIGLFYKLNNTKIPSKYKFYQNILEDSDNKIDFFLYPHFNNFNHSNATLKSFVRDQPQNRNWRGLKNKLNFMIDSFRAYFKDRGFIISFSGVDGAGKTTVITNLKTKIESQLRKKVIVLHHRPSLLPILSAWVKGRERAELEAKQQKPHSGKNRSFISSLIRFGYYYTDYLFGQVYIKMRYINRGYIVIYNRYYFDFIFDGKRSNITLPTFITKAAYRLISKPKLNIFLYADSDVILDRKQDLTREKIEELTNVYLHEFKESSHADKKDYITIKNIHLSKTLDIVFQNVTSKVS